MLGRQGAFQARWGSTVFFVGALSFLVAWSAGTSRWMGYSQVENDAAAHLLGSVLGDAPTSAPDAPQGFAASLSNHGLIPVLMRLPYAAAARAAERLRPTPAGERPALGEAIFSLAPQVETALLMLIVALWVGRELDAARGRRWAVAALLSTPLWPYAYIGIETVQSLMLALTAFLAVGPCRIRRPWRVFFLVLCASAAVAAKSQGLLLVPAVVFLLVRAGRSEITGPLLRAPGVAVALGVVAAARVASSAMVARWLAAYQPGAASFPGGAESENLVRSLFDAAINLAGYLASPNKGLLVFAPLALWGLVLAAGANEWRRDRARFLLLVAGGLAGALSWLVFWTDETWGPRYLHPILVPSIVVLALTARPRPKALLVAAVLVGGIVNGLGMAVHYGTLYKTAHQVEATTLGSFQFDPRWHHARFNARVLAGWMGDPRGVAPSHPYANPAIGWMTGLPAEVAPKVADLGKLARPQPVALRVLIVGETPSLRPFAWSLVVAGALGTWLLFLSCRLPVPVASVPIILPQPDAA